MAVRTKGCPGSKSLHAPNPIPAKKGRPPVWGAGRHARNDWHSEVDLGSQLHAARGAEGTDLAERADCDVGAGVAVGFNQVERVEAFQAELQLRLSLAQDV